MIKYTSKYRSNRAYKVSIKLKGRFFKYIPAVVIIYFGAMILSTFGVWDMNVESVSKARSVLKDANAGLPLFGAFITLAKSL